MDLRISLVYLAFVYPKELRSGLVSLVLQAVMRVIGVLFYFAPGISVLKFCQRCINL